MRDGKGYYKGGGRNPPEREATVKQEYVIEREGRKFVRYGGLLDEAHSQGLASIATSLIQIPGPENGEVAIAIATVTTERGTFSGIGDASPANVSQFLATATIRMAETRAKARALRDAVNVDMTALEELTDHEVEPAFVPASAKQIDFIIDLAHQLDWNEEKFAAHFETPAEEMSRDEASKAIEEMMALRVDKPKPGAAPAKVTQIAEKAPLGAQGKATEPQLRAIFSINRKLGFSEEETTEMCRSLWDCLPKQLTKVQASKWIQQLQEEAK